MTYEKPGNITYTQMAMWVDNNYHKVDCDTSILYEYLYHLSNMLAHRFNYCTNERDYDDFSLYCASRLYMRLYDDKNMYKGKEIKPIKSTLNYLKQVIYPYKCDFFKNSIETVEDSLMETNFDATYFAHIDRLSFQSSVSTISQTVRNYLQKLPRKKDSSQWHNIYISCMLTLLNSITPDVDHKIGSIDESMKVYLELRELPPILYGLGEEYQDYIKVLVNEVRHIICKELTWKSGMEITTQSMSNDFIMSDGGDDCVCEDRI